MGASRTATAKGAASTASGTGAGFASDATGIGSSLVPELTKEATNPQGYTPTQTNNMLVAGEQGAGGANAGITGQADLEAARTHNTGALSGVLDQAARNRTQTLSSNALNVAGKNADLQQKQKQEGMAGLQGMYGTDVGAQLKSEGLVPEDLQAEAPNNFQDVLGGINATSGLIGAFKKPGGGGQGG